MIKEIAWNIFKTTGDINTFLELKQIQECKNEIGKIDNSIIEPIKEEKNGIN